jgi:hypothetical protein
VRKISLEKNAQSVIKSFFFILIAGNLNKILGKEMRRKGERKGRGKIRKGERKVRKWERKGK